MSEVKSIEKMTFEQALSELEQIVRKIDSGQEDLDSSIKAYERGAALKNFCEQKLKDAKLKIDKVVQNKEGESSLEGVEL